MSELSIEQFPDFFRALHGADREPFPWQTMLLERVVDKGWPELLDLPTASGKTACIDVAVFALAHQAHLDWRRRTTARRVFFVVDRRIVVDEAYGRAKSIADALSAARSGVLRRVADLLRRLSRTDLPLAVARLRGGVAPGDGWANIPTQPAVVTGTVDQVGSRLLFRSYGCSPRVAPVHAALVAYDSLVILDEAHCARPFQQTAGAVRDYLDPRRWTTGKAAVAPPLQLMTMTATPSPGTPDDRRFPTDAERGRALDHPKLRERREAKKLAKLELVKNKDFVRKAREAVQSLLAENPQLRRIAVMVNRVQTALDVYKEITAVIGDARVELLTGRLRPVDRDKLISGLHGPLKAGSNVSLADEKPIILITTQCLEVGADFDFDALVSECAASTRCSSGSAGSTGWAPARPARRSSSRGPDVTKDADDFVYGKALKQTWDWLVEAVAIDGVADFGIGAMHGHKARLLADRPGKFETLLAPASDAPVLMPAHVDLLCQTSPRPEPDPDVSVFLHGFKRARPEIFVAFRADLPADRPPADDEDRGRWVQAVGLVPPLPSECLTVPLHRFRAILRGDVKEPDADVEAAKTNEEPPDSARAPPTSWRGGTPARSPPTTRGASCPATPSSSPPTRAWPRRSAFPRRGWTSRKKRTTPPNAARCCGCIRRCWRARRSTRRQRSPLFLREGGRTQGRRLGRRARPRRDGCRLPRPGPGTGRGPSRRTGRSPEGRRPAPHPPGGPRHQRPAPQARRDTTRLARPERRERRRPDAPGRWRAFVARPSHRAP